MSEEACSVWGGTFCPNPTDCSVLQACIGDLSVEARTTSPAYATYLEAAPNITDSTDYEQCAATRMFFGFDPDFINDIQICDDIEQLRFSRDFMFLATFTGQGTDLEPEPLVEPILETPEAAEQPEDNMPDPVPRLELPPIDRCKS